MASGPMILSCSQCGGMMKVDEAKVPANRKFKVRCPHCQYVDVVTGQSVAPEVSATGPLEARNDQPARLKQSHAIARDRESSLDVQRSHGDIHFPADIGDVEPLAKKLMSRKMWLICWVVGSVTWVGLFALLVNLILPGPYGGRPVTGLPPQEEATSFPGTGLLHQPSGRSNQQNPAVR